MVKMQPKGKGELTINVKYPLTERVSSFGGCSFQSGNNKSILYTQWYCPQSQFLWLSSAYSNDKRESAKACTLLWFIPTQSPLSVAERIQHHGERQEVPPSAPPAPLPRPRTRSERRGNLHPLKLPQKHTKHLTCRRAPRSHAPLGSKVHAWGFLQLVLVKEGNSYFQNGSSG